MIEIEQQIKPIPELIIGDSKPETLFDKLRFFLSKTSVSSDGSFFINTNWKIGKGK
jgi:hypothetical protein